MTKIHKTTPCEFVKLLYSKYTKEYLMLWWANPEFELQFNYH